MKEILHSGWHFIHQDHDHHKFSVARGMAKVTFLRTTVVPLRGKHSYSICGNIILVPSSVINIDDLVGQMWHLTAQK